MILHVLSSEWLLHTRILCSAADVVREHNTLNKSQWNSNVFFIIFLLEYVVRYVLSYLHSNHPRVDTTFAVTVRSIFVFIKSVCVVGGVGKCSKRTLG